MLTRCLIILSWLIAALPVWADNPFDPLLNKVTLQLTAEQWVTTNTALVTIGVNAAVTDGDLGKLQQHVMDKLNQLAKAEWHMTAFNRSLDQSGLEKVQISAQARLPSEALSGLRNQAKSISKPGETFSLDSVEFTPSDDEIRAANANLRHAIYQQAIAELAQLNKLYPDQKYYLHEMNFLGMMMPPQPMNLMARSKMMMAGDANANLSVGDKLKMTAIAVLAAAPNPDVIKLVHT